MARIRDNLRGWGQLFPNAYLLKHMDWAKKPWSGAQAISQLLPAEYLSVWYENQQTWLWIVYAVICVRTNMK